MSPNFSPLISIHIASPMSSVLTASDCEDRFEAWNELFLFRLRCRWSDFRLWSCWLWMSGLLFEDPESRLRLALYSFRLHVDLLFFPYAVSAFVLHDCFFLSSLSVGSRTSILRLFEFFNDLRRKTRSKVYPKTSELDDESTTNFTLDTGSPFRRSSRELLELARASLTFLIVN